MFEMVKDMNFQNPMEDTKKKGWMPSLVAFPLTSGTPENLILD